MNTDDLRIPRGHLGVCYKAIHDAVGEPGRGTEITVGGMSLPIPHSI